MVICFHSERSVFVFSVTWGQLGRDNRSCRRRARLQLNKHCGSAGGPWWRPGSTEHSAAEQPGFSTHRHFLLPAWYCSGYLWEGCVPCLRRLSGEASGKVALRVCLVVRLNVREPRAPISHCGRAVFLLPGSYLALQPFTTFGMAS